MKAKRVSTKSAMKKAFEDMRKSGLHPESLFNRQKLIRECPETTLRLGLFGI